MRVAVIVPVSAPVDVTLFERLELGWGSVEHAKALVRAGANVTMFLAGRRQRERIDGLQIDVRPVALGFAELVRAVRRTRPDVTHLFHLREPTALVASAALLPKVVAEYNGGRPPARRWVRRATFEASQRLHAIVFTAEAIARPFFDARALSPAARLVTLPEISSRLPIATPTERRHVLIVGRQEAPKDPHVALRAFRRMLNVRPELRLIWASWGGRASPEVMRAIDDPRIDVVRVTDAARMAHLYASAAVMIHASRREVCGAAFVEALQQGCPIAATDIPAFRANAPEDAVTLCPIGDDDALAQAALRLMVRPSAPTAARRHFEDQLSFDAIARRRLAVYDA